MPKIFEAIDKKTNKIVSTKEARYLLNNLWIKIPNCKSQMSNNTQCQNPNVQNTVAKGLF